MSVFLVLCLILSSILFAWYLYFNGKYKFWAKLNIPHLKPVFPIGSLNEILKVKHFAYVSQNLYWQLKHFGDFAGMYFFASPMLLVLTPEFAKTVLVRDFGYFTDRGLYYNRKADVLSANLFFLDGHEWRLLRQKFSPTFTSGKIKTMFQTMVAVGDELTQYIDRYLEHEPLLDIKDMLARYTTDIIGSVGFGVECNSIVDPKSKFREMGKRMFNYSKMKNIKSMLCMLYKKEATAVGAKFSEDVVIEFLEHLVHSTIEHRRENNIRRNDFMQLMIDLHKDDRSTVEAAGDSGAEGETETTLTVDDIAAQCFVFFFAGFETSSTTISFCLYEMAMNPDIQTKLRDEILDSLQSTNGAFTYDSIQEMPYLDEVLSETLRKYPPVSTLHRAVSKDYRLPNGSVLPTGTFVTIPTYAFHHDPELYPNPDVFDPERFNEENKANRRPCSYLPFGEGSRNCVGMRFGLLQTKLGIATMLRNFKFAPCYKTHIPLEIDPVGLVFVPKQDMYLKVEKCVN